MKSNFKFRVDSLKTISGSASGDSAVAADAVMEMVSFVESEFNKINAFETLEEVMSTSDKVLIVDSLVAIRHVCSVMENLKDFYKASELKNIFNNGYETAEKRKDSAELTVTGLLGLLDVT